MDDRWTLISKWRIKKELFLGWFAVDAETERKVRALVVFELEAAEVWTVVAHFFEGFAYV